MFSLVSGVYDNYFAPTQLNVLVVGASGTGKTALLERLKVTEFTKKAKPQPPQSTLEVPESFLPISLRGSKTQIHKSSLHKKKKKPAKNKDNQNKGKRGFLACPAPSKYNKANDSSSSDEEDDDDDDDNESIQVPEPNGMGRTSSTDMSLKDVPIGDSETSDNNGKDRCETIPETNSVTEDTEADDDDQEYDLKSKARMLPLHKIRPTIGQNLGRVEMCGAQCRVWDLGGKMHDLWSRYYDDADAVVFVWKIVDDSNPMEQLTNSKEEDSDDDDEEDWPPVTAAQQLALLEKVRSSIPDDVPFLIWGHWFPADPTIKKSKAYQYNEPYSTGTLLPHYHNPLMTVYFGSAKTGAGVRTAMEWLIPSATRQKKYRVKNSDDTEKA